MSVNDYNLLKQGNPSALESIYSRYGRQIYWLGRSLLRDTFIVETLVQDTFLKLWVHRDRIEDPRHVFFFLRFVMKRSCNTYYSIPKNKFFRQVNSLDAFENYQDFMVGFDPRKEDEHLEAQEREQVAFDRINKVLPLLSSKRRDLIQLCLKYEFRYKPIAELTGTSITDVTNEVKRAIADIKKIVNHEHLLQGKDTQVVKMQVQGSLTPEQEKVLNLRLQKKLSFASIASDLNLSQKQVHQEFMAAYRLMQEKHRSQLETV